MATEAYTLQLVYYQLQQETAYYVAELDSVKKEQHRKNIVNLYALLTQILSAKSPKNQTILPAASTSTAAISNSLAG